MSATNALIEPNHIIAQRFREHMFQLIHIYATVTGKKVKAALIRTKLNIDVDDLLQKLIPYIEQYGKYIDAGDIDAFVNTNHTDQPYSSKVLKLIKLIRLADAAHIPDILANLRQIKKACVAYSVG